MPSGYLKHASGVGRKKQEGSSSKGSRRGTGRGSHCWREFPLRLEGKWWKGNSAPSHIGTAVAADVSADIDGPESPPPPPPPRFIDDGLCMVCLDTPLRVLDLGRCGHVACLPCFRRYYTARDLDRYPLRCMVCEKRIPIRELVRDHVFETETDLARARRLAKLAEARDRLDSTECKQVRCPRCTHTWPADHQGVVICPGCTHPVCTRFDHDVLPAAVRDAMPVGSIAICPRCGDGIERDGGCCWVRCRCSRLFNWYHERETPMEGRDYADRLADLRAEASGV